MFAFVQLDELETIVNEFDNDQQPRNRLTAGLATWTGTFLDRSFFSW